jgi:hypothetical protein
MEKLKDLDALNTQIAQSLFAAPPMEDWMSVKATLAFTPDASVGSQTFHFLRSSGLVDKGSSPRRSAELMVGQLAEQHWRLTQDLGLPRWYKMIFTVERTGKFSVDFEYKDDYKEGDIMHQL